MEVKIKNLFFPAKIKEIKTTEIISNPRIKDKWIETKKTISDDVETYARNIQMLVDIISFERNLKILDVGCGFGIDIIELANLGAECVGLDAVEDYSRFITVIGRKFEMKLRGDFDDACNLPYENESFDVVTSKNFFEHVKDFNLAMKEQIRVLKHGGRIIIRDGNFLCPLSLYGLLFKYPIRTDGKYGGIKWLFTKGKVRKNLYEVGGWAGKDEDIHSIFWWKSKMKHYPVLQVIELTTTRAYKTRGKLYSTLLEPFLGSVLIVAVKKNL